MRKLLASIPERLLDYTAVGGVAFFFGYGLGKLSCLSTWWLVCH